MIDSLDVHDLPEEDVRFLAGIADYLRRKAKSKIEDERIKSAKIHLNDFSFKRAREALKDFKGSLSDTVIEERRNYL